MHLNLPPIFIGEVAERSEVGGVVILIGAKNLKVPDHNRTRPFTQGDNSDGRLQIADDRYRVVGNRRPLQCHSERKRRISMKNLNRHETLRCAQGDSLNVVLSVSEESRITNYELRIKYCQPLHRKRSPSPVNSGGKVSSSYSYLPYL